MEQLHLAFSAQTMLFLEEHLLDDHKVEEFIQRLEAILLNDYVKFYYAPFIQHNFIDFFDQIDAVGYKTRFLSLLNRSNVEEVEKGQFKESIYQFFGNGYSHIERILPDFSGKYLFDKKYVAFIDFSGKEDQKEVHLILEIDQKPQNLKQFEVLSNYKAYHNWSLKCLPRKFDPTNQAKHPTSGKSGFGSDLRCDMLEVERALQRAFHQQGNHEHQLLLYHLKENEKPILFLKSSQMEASMDYFFHFHGYHISENEAQTHYGVNPSNLQRLKSASKYINRELT